MGWNLHWKIIPASEDGILDALGETQHWLAGRVHSGPARAF
jgi:hypothetical protein